MRVIVDIETNSLRDPTKVWVIVCKDVESGQLHIFREVTDDQQEKEKFLTFAAGVQHWIGHNILEYDLVHLARLVDLPSVDPSNVCDTLIVSRLINYSRPGGHSIEQYGKEFGLDKIDHRDFTKYSAELEHYCIRDVEINHRVYDSCARVLRDPAWQQSIRLEHAFQLIVNDLHNNGFSFNVTRAEKLLERVSKELKELDEKILEAFPPREILIREFTPRATKFGTISKQSVPKSLWENIHNYEVAVTYRHTRMEPFNPSSHKQLIQVLNEAGWKPENKTQTHIDTERELNRLRYNKDGVEDVDLKRKMLDTKLENLKKTGWKVDETNLGTLPESAPAPARLLAKRILLEARRRSLVEWLGLVQEDSRIHGKFVGIGAWTHRMAHQQPNTANIPKEFKEDGSPKLLGKEMRELWCAPRNRLLVGVDAEGIQLRIFAHYIDDPEFTKALVEGRKDDKTDPHSLNQRILGDVCATRQAAKRFIYALLLGGGISKLAQILGCSVSQAQEALNRLLQRYGGFKYLKDHVIPNDAKRGYFLGLDGRKVLLPGESISERKHLCMSGYLQNGEAIVIKRAALIIDKALAEEKALRKWFFVNIVHDELQSETRNDMGIATQVAKIKADAIRIAGEELKLKCPLAGSYWNDDTKEYTIGTNWYQTH